ncbi:hypothetical protein ACFQJ7_09160 [Halovenus rubra]|uniref:Rpa-associated protein n=2 Tax=Halovenus rubra TaxID=869890 RepID=A0ABD5X5C9_9EURY|nr:hypothetical protein [Halovenus rubra]
MSDSEDDNIGDREVAYRLFAAEFDDADYSYSESDDDRSPNYVITPTGARVNRLFAVGVLTAVEEVSDDVLRGRVVDPTGAFVTYAGQYQPDVQAFLERVDTPTFVAMTGKARTFQPEDSDQVFTSVRPESINEVDAETRDRWTVQAAEQTLDRIGTIGTAMTRDTTGDSLEAELQDLGVRASVAAGIPLALSHYETTATYLDAVRDLALDAAQVVAGERDEVDELQASPDERGTVSAMELVDSGVKTTAPMDKPAASESTETDNSQSTATETASSDEASETSVADATAEPESVDSTTATDVSRQTEPETQGDDTGDSTQPQETATDTESETVSEATEPESGESNALSESESATESGVDSPDDLGDFDPDEFELEEETREQVKEEFGTEFQSGTEVGNPGEADIETPDPEPESESDKTKAESSESKTADESESAMEHSDDKPTQKQPDDLQDAVVELMAELDEGDGARKAAVVEEMTGRYTLDADEIETAIQDALMDGECYEPGDGRLKPI